MEKEELIGALEALLFASGRTVEIKTLCNILNVEKNELNDVAECLKNNLMERSSGIQLLRINESYQLATLEKYYSYICALMDNRPKPNLSQAALEVLSIIAYNPNITRAEMEKIRGVSSDSAMNKLLEYNLIEDVGRLDAPGRPVMYKTTDEFLRLFGYSRLSDMPDLPKVKEELDQIRLEETFDEDNDLEEIKDYVEEENKDTLKNSENV